MIASHIVNDDQDMPEIAAISLEHKEDKLGNDVPEISVITCIDDQAFVDQLMRSSSI